MKTPTLMMVRADQRDVLDRVADGVFDGDVRPELLAEFVDDPRHHLAVAVASGEVVAAASAVHYVHPDKPAELWVNEVGVAPAFRRRGLGKELLRLLFEHGLRLGCRAAWVLTEGENEAAARLYASLGGRESPAVMFSFELPGRDAGLHHGLGGS